MSTNYLSNKAKVLLATKALNLSSDTLKWMLVTSSYTPNKDNDFATSATAAEISTTNYTAGFGGAGRQALTSQAVTQDNTNDLAKFTAAANTWTSLGPATGGPVIAYALLIQEITNDAASPIIATYDCAISTNSGNLTLTPNASGLVTLT